MITRHWNITLVACTLAGVCVMGPAQADPLSKGGSKQVQSADMNEGGPDASAATSSRRANVSFGQAFEGRRLATSQFGLRSGFMAAALSAKPPTPVDQLTITVLYAKTQTGLTILDRTWQRETRPVFYWEAPAGGLDVLGYSHTVTAVGTACEPDQIIDTMMTMWSTTNLLGEGQHQFCVKAINSAGSAGTPAVFNVWVDTTPPVLTSSTPASGSLFNATTFPELTISATLSDAHSGIDPSTIVLSINDTPAAVTFAGGVASVQSTGMISEGSHTVELDALDYAGNALTTSLWDFIVDRTPPVSGEPGLLIRALDGGTAQTPSVYVTLELQATDAVTGVEAMLIRNAEDDTYAEYAYATVLEFWQLHPVRGMRQVYALFRDEAGNVSQPVIDEIELTLRSPQTSIISGPAGVTPEQTAQFTVGCSEADCVYKYAFNNEPWSAEWMAQTTITATELGFGNHYFKVKAAKDTNQNHVIDLDEEDPTPAERTWVIGIEGPAILLPQGPPIKLWRLD